MRRLSRTSHVLGFTLMELLVTLALVGLLASISVPLLEVQARSGQERELREALRTLRMAIDAYKQAADDGRIAHSADASGYPPSLNVLVEGAENQRDPNHGRLYFLRRLPRDPLHSDPQAPAEKTWGRRSYASPPQAPREGADVFDVYSLDPRAGLNGVPYQQW